MSVRTVELQEVCRIVQGGRTGLSGNDFVPEGYPAYGAGGLNGFLPTYEFDEPAVVLSAIGARCGKCFYAEGKWHSLANTQLLFPDLERVDPKFLWYQLNDETRWHRSGTGQPFIKPADVKLHRIYLPPLPKQRRIAAILDQADALRAKRRAALKKLDELTQSIFLDMFGDPATNPKGWPVVSIKDICEVKGGKRLPKGEEYSSVPTPFRYIRVVDLKGGRVDESALVYLKPETQAKIARYVVNAGDVIISIAGSIGLVAPVTQSLDGVNLTENAAKLVPRSCERYEAEYLARFLETHHSQGQIGSQIGQVTIGKLALFRIEKMRVPLPPIAFQREFVRRAANLTQHRAALERSASRLDELFSSLQHRAFRGEL